MRVSECLRSFDPKKSKMLRGIDDQSPISTVSIPQNPVYNSSANFGTGIVGVGGVVGTEQAQYMNPSQQQTFIIQAPMQPTPGLCFGWTIHKRFSRFMAIITLSAFNVILFLLPYRGWFNSLRGGSSCPCPAT